MFADAYNKASSFTHPIVASVRFFDGTVECSLGAFVILNPDGWIVTVAHILSGNMVFQKHAREIADYKEQVLAIEQDPGLNFKQKKKRMGRLKSNPKWVINYSLWWGFDGLRVDKFKVLPGADLAVGQLTPFDPSTISTYPTREEFRKFTKELFDEFLQSRPCGISKKTLEGYHYTLDSFVGREISAQSLKEYLDGQSCHNVKLKFHPCLKALCSWLYQNNHISDNPITKVPAPRTQKEVTASC